MKKEHFIDKEAISEYHLDIHELYKEGLEWVQKFSGEKWTDFNEHDPGVTILEALVFGITDICFRLGFDAIDFLTEEDGKLNAKDQALYPAQEILSTHPVTINDFRVYIFDKLKDVSNVWLEEKPGDIRGLYRLILFARPEIHFYSADKSYLQEVREKIKLDAKSLWPDVRNLGEDLEEDDIVVLKSQPIYVQTRIILKSADSLENVLAKIVFAVDLYFNPQLKRKSLTDLQDEGIPNEEIFEGPFLEGGFVDPTSLEQSLPTRITKARLVSIISNIPGVEHIEDLTMLTGENEKNLTEHTDKVDIEPGRIPRLFFERNTPDKSGNQQLLIKHHAKTYLTVKMRRRNQEDYLDVNYDRMLKTLREIQAIESRSYDLDQSDLLSKNYEGEFRPFNSYSSIQNDLSYIYAINQFGTSKFDPPERKAEALQLKAYLLLFEQLMANFLAQVDNLKKLYSPFHLEESYFTKPLTDANIESVEKLYTLSSNKADLDLETVMKKVLTKANEFHPHLARKSRILDYMLAIYGERFMQSTLKRMRTNKDDILGIVKNKATMLEHLVHFNKKRSSTPKPGASGIEEMSGFEVKVALLLGIHLNDGAEDKPEIEVVFDETSNTDEKKVEIPKAQGNEYFKVIDHILLRPNEERVGGIPPSFYSFQCTVVFPENSKRMSDPYFQELAEETIYFSIPSHIQAHVLWFSKSEYSMFEMNYDRWEQDPDNGSNRYLLAAFLHDKIHAKK